MTNLVDFARLARQTMANHGLDDWSFGWDRAVKRNGQCDQRKRRITMSRPLTTIATDAEAFQTLLHEIAHALVGAGHGHDRVWLGMARSIGYTGHTNSARQNFDRVAATAPYVDYCPNGHESPRWRKKPARARATSCGRCSPRFDRRYLIQTKRNPALAVTS
jgi:SprT protein